MPFQRVSKGQLRPFPGVGRHKLGCALRPRENAILQRTPEVGDGGRTVLGVQMERPVQGAFCARAQQWIDVAHRHQAVCLQEANFGLGGRCISEQVVKRSRKAVDIGAPVGMAGITAVLFQRRVVDGAAPLHHRDRAVVGHHQFHKSKIYKLDQAAGCQADVGGLDIAVHDWRLLGVQILKRMQQLARPIQHEQLGDQCAGSACGFDALAQVNPRHIIHHQNFGLAQREKVRDFGQRRVVKAREHRSLLIELRPRLALRLWCGARIAADLFQRALAALQAQVFGKKDGAHATLAVRAKHTIALVEDVAGSWNHVGIISACRRARAGGL